MTIELHVVNQEQVPYRIGDTIVHPIHGIGLITRLDEMKQGEQSRLCYVIAVHDKVTLWVPVDAAAKCGLRSVASASRFTGVFGILSSAAQPLSEQSRERQMEINERFNQWTLEAICSIIRDLTVRGLSKRLNESDTKMLKRARKLLLDEWVLAMHILHQEAQSQLSALLHESAALSN
jgi:CarD family transcriptional regulator